jgi:hypothetical protein
LTATLRDFTARTPLQRKVAFLEEAVVGSAIFVQGA